MLKYMSIHMFVYTHVCGSSTLKQPNPWTSQLASLPQLASAGVTKKMCTNSIPWIIMHYQSDSFPVTLHCKAAVACKLAQLLVVNNCVSATQLPIEASLYRGHQSYSRQLCTPEAQRPGRPVARQHLGGSLGSFTTNSHCPCRACVSSSLL